jgi:hypothetical protein
MLPEPDFSRLIAVAERRHDTADFCGLSIDGCRSLLIWMEHYI